MKRNTLMKRMAVVALAATMSIGMAVPAMAANTKNTNAAGVEDNQSGTSTTTAYRIHIDRRGGYGPTIAADDYLWNNYVVNTFANDSLILYFAEKPTTTSDDGDFKLVTEGSNWTSLTGTITTVNDTLENSKWKDSKDRFYNYDATPIFGGDRISATVDDANQTVSFTAKKFGTAGYRISRVHLKHMTKDGVEGWYARNEYYDVTVTNRVDAKNVSELLDNVRKNIPLDQADTANNARIYAQNALQKAINDAEPVESSFEKNKDWRTSEADFEKNYVNQPITVTAHVNPVTDFHAASIGRTGTFKANVAVSRPNVGTIFTGSAVDFTIPMGNPYTDLDSSKYYYNNVVKALEAGVVSPQDATTFGVNNTVTRAEFVTWLWKKEGSPVVGTAEHFKDYVDINDLSADEKTAINWATEQGYISGWTNATFNPTHTLTRAQVIQILYNIAKNPSGANETTFSDVAHGAWYEKAVNWGTSKAVAKIAGYTDGTFRPTAEVKKADAVEFLYRG